MDHYAYLPPTKILDQFAYQALPRWGPNENFSFLGNRENHAYISSRQGETREKYEQTEMYFPSKVVTAVLEAI